MTYIPTLVQLIYEAPMVPVTESTPPPSVVSEESSESTSKTYTQTEFDTHLANARKKYQAETRTAVDELNALRAKATLSAKERQELDTRITDLNTKLLTKEELADQEKSKLEKVHEQQVTTLTGERDSWQQKVTASTITRNITDAAVESDAFSPQQIVAVIGPNTRLDEVKDADGNSTGEFEVKVKFNDTDKEGKPVVLDLDVSAAVKRMKEMATYINLFKNNGTGGLGTPNRAGGNEPDLAEIAKDPEKWRKFREGNIQ